MKQNKPSIIILHGAIGAASQMQPLKDCLAIQYDVHLLDFSGHGGKEIPTDGFTIQNFAEDVLYYMQESNLEQVVLFGYSMGGYVAMYLAKHKPDKILGVLTLGTKYYWDEETAAKEIKMLNADRIEEKLPSFAVVLAARHAPNSWKEVLGLTVNMLQQLGSNNVLSKSAYQHIQCPCCIMRGANDMMVTKEEGEFVNERLQKGCLIELGDTPHPIEKVNVNILKQQVDAFMNSNF